MRNLFDWKQKQKQQNMYTDTDAPNECIQAQFETKQKEKKQNGSRVNWKQYSIKI